MKFGKCFDFVDGIGILEGETWTEVGTGNSSRRATGFIHGRCAASTGCLPSLCTASASGGLLVKGETPVLANGDGRGRFSGLLGSLGGVFTVTSARFGDTEQTGNLCIFWTSSFLECSKRSFCFAALIMLPQQATHTTSEHSPAGKSSPTTVFSW